MAKFLAACIQMNSGNDMAANAKAACQAIRQAAKQGAEFITLPENTLLMSGSAHELLEKSTHLDDNPYIPQLQKVAKEVKKWVLIGAVALRAKGKERLVNCSLLINPKGKIAAHYDKIHLYDVELDNGEVYTESQRFEHGNKLTIADLPWGKLGMTICYDLRFPYLFRSLAKHGAYFITVPSSFVRYTGEAHWHTLLRARAIENGCYIIAPAQTGSHPNKRETFGHSLIIDPWGHVLADAGKDVGIITAMIDTERVEQVRKALPSLNHDREFLF